MSDLFGLEFSLLFARSHITPINPLLAIMVPTGPEVLAEARKLCAEVEQRTKRRRRMSRKKRRGWA